MNDNRRMLWMKPKMKGNIILYCKKVNKSAKQQKCTQINLLK